MLDHYRLTAIESNLRDYVFFLVNRRKVDPRAIRGKEGI
jgi:hypothetical protein